MGVDVGVGAGGDGSGVVAKGASGANGAGISVIGTGVDGTTSTGAAAWNQLCLQFAQRTVRPSAPIALSGTR
jgi:hypothetical protein